MVSWEPPSQDNTFSNGNSVLHLCDRHLMVLIVALRRETAAQFTETDAKVQTLHCLAHSHSPVMQQKNPGAPVS